LERAEVVIVGGGPAGSACARYLAAAGRDVLLLDAASFPRDKPCAGWITPEVLRELPFPIDDYAREHVAQPITRFRIGRIGGRTVEIDYGSPVSWGIRRCEFDAALLRASQARVVEGERVRTVERVDGTWVINGVFSSPLLVGAGGHFCPVARRLGGPTEDASVVVAREVEFRLEDGMECRIEEGRPELHFSRDLRGYGWCFRKGNWLNVGLGRLDTKGLASHVNAFVDFLARDRRIGALPADGWRGHAYRVRQGASRRVAGEGFLLVGDAAGLAAPASGEGILPALVSGRLAAAAILAGTLDAYPARLRERLGPEASARTIPGWLRAPLGAAILAFPGIVRRVVLDRGFLHRAERTPPPPQSPTR
jgi:geranylgeranyl reductase family protein